MIRTIGAAAMLTLAAIMPQQATAQDALGGALGGALLGGVIGGAATGRAGGAVAGALIGGTLGAAIGANAERRRDFYWYRGSCYRQVTGGYTLVNPQYCG